MHYQYPYQNNRMPYGNERKKVQGECAPSHTMPSFHKDCGKEPFVVNIEEVTKQNTTFRTALWTGKYLQVTVMCIPVGESIGLEIHTDVDQFIRIEEGCALVQMGEDRKYVECQRKVDNQYAIVIPAGTWHNIINTGNVPLKVYSIYAPPQHSKGTVHCTKKDAQQEERHIEE